MGPLAVRWFGLLALVGLALAVWLSLRELRRHQLSSKAALDALAWGLPAAIVCARVVHVLGYWDYYLTSASQLWQLNLDGLSLWGGLLGGAAVAAARLRRDPLRRRRVFDAIAPYVALGIVVGKLGEFLDGHGQGLPSDLPWATQYASRLAATPDFGVPRHPAQLYEALVALALFGILIARPRRLPAGTTFAAFLVLYGGARVLLGAVRLDPSFLFGLQIEQLLALGAVAFGLLYGVRPVLATRLASLTARRDESETAQARAKEDSMAA